MNIPETLYRLRTARGMSQEALADALGVSRQAVSKWETGAAVPDVDKIVQLSDFYGVTTDEILKGEAAATQQGRGSPEAQPAGDGDDGQTEAGAEDAAGDAVPGDGQEASGAARFGRGRRAGGSVGVRCVPPRVAGVLRHCVYRVGNYLLHGLAVFPVRVSYLHAVCAACPRRDGHSERPVPV